MNGLNNLYEFGSYRFDSAANTLWRENELVQLSPKGSELLRVILTRQGEIVSKQEIFDSVWPETFVEEGVLTQNIYLLRKTLGTDPNGNQIIENIARRGYRLNIPVTVLTKTPAANSTPVTTPVESDASALTDPGGKPVPRRRLVVPVILVLALVTGSFLVYRQIRPRVRAYFSPPLENVQIKKVTDSGQTAFPTLSRDGNFMAFVRGRAVMLRDLKSGKEIKLDIPGADSFGSLQFSVDGEFLYFRPTEFLRKQANILQVSRFGGDTRILAERTFGNFGVSADGTKLAFVRKSADSRQHDLVVRNISNGEETVVNSKMYPDLFFAQGSISWSPDAKQIAYVANAGTERSTRLFLLDLATKQETEIRSPRLRGVEQAVWMLDGESMIVSATEPGRKSQLWKLYVPGGEVHRITNDLDNFGSVSLSADGKQLLALKTSQYSNIWLVPDKTPPAASQLTVGNSNNFGQTSLAWGGADSLIVSATPDGSAYTNLWRLSTNGGGRHQLTANRDFHTDFANVLAANGQIFYNANQNRLVSVFRMDADGSNATQLTASESGLRLFPVPSPDGRFVYFLFRNRETSVVKRLDLSSGSEEVFFADEKFTPAGFLTISPDGKRLAFINLTGEADNESDETSFPYAVVSTENPAEVKILNARSGTAIARFAPDSKSLDYVGLESGRSKIMRQPLDGGEPYELLKLDGQRIFNFAWSHDGETLAVSRGEMIRDAVLLSGIE